MSVQPIPVCEPNEFQVLGMLDSLAHRQAVRLFHETKDQLVQQALARQENELVAPLRAMPVTM